MGWGRGRGGYWYWSTHRRRFWAVSWVSGLSSGPQPAHPPPLQLPGTSALLARSLVASLDVLECVVCKKKAFFASQHFSHFSHENGGTATDELTTATNFFS